MKQKFLTLLALLLCAVTSSWADDTYEYYYNGSSTINTSSFFSGTAVSTNAYASNLKFTTTAGEITASKVAKMNSSGHVDFTTTANSTVTIVMMSKAKTDSKNANTVKLDTQTSADFGSTSTANVISDPIVFENVAAGSHTITRGGQECGLVYVKVVQEAMTAPAITVQPAACTAVALNGTTTLSVDATPSSGTCTFNWYACDSEGVISGESLGTSKDYTVPTSATASAATLYYKCVVGDGGSNTTPSNVAKINVIDRAAKQTWDFTTIEAEDIMYNETFYTYKGSSTYNHNFTKATDGTLQDNYGNDLLKGIIVRRDAGDAPVYVYCDANNNRYGINLQGASDKPGIWKIPVEAGKNYQVTYTSNTSSKTVGYAINSGATFVSGDLTSTIATAFTNTASFIASASANGTMVLHNAGTDANYSTIVKIEEVAASPSLIVDPSTAEAFSYVEGNGPSAAQSFAVTLNYSENPVSAQLSSSNYEMSKTGEADSYTSEAFDDLTNGSTVYVRLKAGLAKASAYDATLTFANADVEDDVVINLSGSVTGQTYTVTYDLNGGSGDAPTQDPVEAGTQITLPAAASKDFYTFNGWLCNADNVVYDAEALYTMTAANTTFTAQWTGPTYSSTLDFAAVTKAGTTAANAIEDFLASGNMVISGKGSRSDWEPSTENFGFIGYKLKDEGVTVKFMAQAGKKVTITLGSNDGAVTLKKNGTSSTIPSHKGNTNFSVIAFDADEDMLVEISTTQDNKTTTLNKIEIEDAIASTNVTVGVTGFATIGLPYATTLPEGVTAYAVSETSATAVTVSEAIAAGTKIPANKGFVIVATPQVVYNFAGLSNTTWQSSIATNKLEATGSSVLNATAEGDFYYFAIIDSTNRKVGFKKCAANASLAANKAYLPGTGLSSNSLVINFDDPTAVEAVQDVQEFKSSKVQKVIKNGQLFIGNYTVAGARVK